MISVIIPVYNVEKYLKRCVDSVINQSYKDLEIILVDDGSPDNCPKMCDNYAKQDNRIKVIHQKNGGQSAARNAGLSVATSDYIAFIDSDDWIAEDTYEYSMNLLHKHDADAVQFGYINANSYQSHTEQPKEIIEIFKGKDILQYYMLSSTKAPGGYSACRCLFSKKKINTYKFREGKINEDMDWKFLAFSNCDKLVVSNQVKYFYFQDSLSTTRGGLKRKDFDLREAADILCDLASKETYGNIRQLGEVKKARTAFSYLCKIAYYGVADSSLDEKQLIKDLTKEHRQNASTLLRVPIPLSRKVLSVLFAVNFKLTKVFIKIIK